MNDILFWLLVPIVLGAAFYTVSRSRAQYSMYLSNASEVITVNREILANNRRMVAVLEEISAELKQRKN